MVESRSRNGFYHDVVHFVDGGWSCDCHKFTMEVSMQSKNDCRHIKIVKYYLSNEWWLIDFVIASYAIKKLYT